MLSKTQIIALNIEAKKTFDELPDAVLAPFRADLEANHPEDPLYMAKATELCTAWRHDFTKKTLSQKYRGAAPTSFKDLKQSDYNLLLSRFAAARGDIESADYYSRRQEDSDRRMWLSLLKKNCEERGLDFPQYPETICQTQFRCSLAEASSTQLRNLTFTCRSRGEK